MPTNLYLTAHQPAKRTRLTSSSIHSIREHLGLSEGCQQVVRSKIIHRYKQTVVKLVKIKIGMFTIDHCQGKTMCTCYTIIACFVPLTLWTNLIY